jgi:hypothetical protein
MTRDEHVAWAKQRALEYLTRGDLNNALASMISDLRKHPEIPSLPHDTMAEALVFVMDKDGARLRSWIEGFS